MPSNAPSAMTASSTTTNHACVSVTVTHHRASLMDGGSLVIVGLVQFVEHPPHVGRQFGRPRQ